MTSRHPKMKESIRGSLSVVHEVAQCLQVGLRFLKVGQVAAVFEHDEVGAW